MAWNTFTCSHCGRRNRVNTPDCQWCHARKNRLDGLMVEFFDRSGKQWVHAHPFIGRMKDCEVWPEFFLPADELTDTEREYARLFSPALGSEYTLG